MSVPTLYLNVHLLCIDSLRAKWGTWPKMFWLTLLLSGLCHCGDWQSQEDLQLWYMVSIPQLTGTSGGPLWTDLGRQRCQWQLCTCTCTCWAVLVANCQWTGCSAQTDHCTHGNQESQTGFGTAQSIVNKMIGLGWRVPRCSHWMNSSQLNEYFVSNTSSNVLYVRHFLSLFTTTVCNEQDI
jgi:hypothetical protein